MYFSVIGLKIDSKHKSDNLILKVIIINLATQKIHCK